MHSVLVFRLLLTLGSAEFIQKIISFLSKQNKMNRHRRDSLFLLCVIEFNASCAASQGGPGWKGTYPMQIMLAGTPPHFSSLLIFRSMRTTLATRRFSVRSISEVDAGRSTGERRSLPFRRQVGQSCHQLRMRPHFLFIPTLFVCCIFCPIAP